jgi:phenylalanyl-tRNA synthetase beta chain
MKASYSWLRALVPQLSASPTELAARLTGAGLEVEATHAFGAGIETCLVVAVVSKRPHPTKTGLNLVTVDRGGAPGGQGEGGPIEIVCGASNVPDPGGLVVLAPLGAHLPAKGMTIERRAIAGVVSEGMLCSEQELGLGDESDGILVLPPGTAAPGALFAEAVPAAMDTVFEIGLTPNRPDGLGHLGLAREAAALFGIAWSPPEPDAPVKVATAEAVDRLVTIVVEDAERCPHYGAAAVVDVTIGPSPAWLRYRLASLGVRPISNVVDVTNLVMLEYGHPMHAFDLDRVRGGKIVVRRAREGETLVTLDGVTRSLVADDLVIADAEGALALAGVMGGATSEIQPTTRRVLFECAYFEPRGVRRASRRHALHTESSHRFERGVDPGDVADVLTHAASLTTSLGRGAAVPGAIHVTGKPLESRHVTLRARRIAQILGIDVPWAESCAILERLGCKIHASGEGVADVTIPSHRPDITREVDLVEEVARVHGMDRIPAVLPAIRPTREGKTREGLLARARAAGVALGLSEAVTYSFVRPQVLEAIGAPPATVVLQNPLSELQSVMRTSLLPGLVDALSNARRHGERDARIFTLGPVFTASPGGGLPEERPFFAAILAGDRPSYLDKARPVDVWDAKGVAEGVVRHLTSLPVELIAFKNPGADGAHADGTGTATSRPTRLHPRGAARIDVRGTPVGTLGLLHPDAADALGLDGGGDIVIVELDLEALETLGRATPQYAPLPRFPASTRDLAVVVSDGVRAGDVESAVREAAGAIAEDVRLFDRFVGGSIPAGHASLAFRVVYRRTDRTLTDVEVDAQHSKAVAEVEARFKATLRA